MGQIQVLDPHVANLIAAGEVVERPASVAKELLENAVDAGASTITIEIKKGGVTFLRVTDDGCGMNPEDVPVCLQRHATSKIRSEDDLSSIGTLGFRGEALAAIASVSRLRIMTRPRNAPVGTILESESGKVLSVVESGCPCGTTILVEELFADVPARRKFLKRDISEAGAVAAVVEKIALSRPDISIRFISDGNLKFQSAGDGDLISAIYAILGKEYAAHLLPVNTMMDGVEVTGYIGTPENVRGNRNYQNFFLNGRYVKSATMTAALEQGFSTFMPSEKFPCCVIHLSLHPAFVDVNVHPTKLEVKFSNERAVFNAVYGAVRGALVQNGIMAYKAASASETKNAGSDLSLTRKCDTAEEAKKEAEKRESAEKTYSQISFADLASDFIKSHAAEPTVTVPKLPSEPSVPEAQNRINPSAAEGSSVQASSVELSSGGVSSMELSFMPTASSEPPVDAHRAAAPNSGISAVPEEKKPSEEKPERDEKAAFVSSADPARKASEKASPQLSSEDQTKTAGQPSAPKPIPVYRIVGVAFECYIILEIEGRLMVIDKHAAHERLIFEKLKKNMEESIKASQLLLIPVPVSLTQEEKAAVHSYEEELEQIGFSFIGNPDGKTVEITAIPSLLDVPPAAELFVTMAGQLASATGCAEVARRTVYEKALFQASCKAAMKGGIPDAIENIHWLCDQLLSLNNIRYCPHGRPVVFELTKSQVESRFGRT